MIFKRITCRTLRVSVVIHVHPVAHGGVVAAPQQRPHHSGPVPAEINDSLNIVKSFTKIRWQLYYIHTGSCPPWGRACWRSPRRASQRRTGRQPQAAAPCPAVQANILFNAIKYFLGLTWIFFGKPLAGWREAGQRTGASSCSTSPACSSAGDTAAKEVLLSAYLVKFAYDASGGEVMMPM